MGKITSILSGFALLAMASFSNAGVISDTVTQNVFIDWWDTYDYVHDINDDGFDLGSALSGTLSIQVSDDGSGWDEFGGDNWEVILFTVEEFDFDTGTINFGSELSFSGDLEVNALGALNADGLLDISVTSLWGDFYLGNSVLTVVTSDVPAPSALLLMGLGLLGLGAVRKIKA